MSRPPLPLKVFVSYAHDDEGLRAELGKHLSALEAEGLLRVWQDRQITAGSDWANAIDESLAGSQIMLLLVSADFLASPYCQGVELAEALRRHDEGTLRVVPVILRSCDWEHSAVARFNALPPDGTPIAEADHPDQLYRMVAQGLRAVVTEWEAVPTDAAGASGTLANTCGPVRARERWWQALAGLALAGVTAVALIHIVWLQPAIGNARAAMRIGLYERALQQTQSVPGWFEAWPPLRSARDKARLGVALYEPLPDWQGIGLELQQQQRKWPQDPDLLVIAAQMALHRENDRGRALVLTRQAIAADAQHAEATFQLGLLLDLSGQVEQASEQYRRAAELGPDSPPYRNNLARSLLDLGRPEEAEAQYALVQQLPLARLEQALALWALGRPAEAAERQREALAMLADEPLMALGFNRRAWVFRLGDHGVRLPVAEEKRCYARLGLAASLALAGMAEVQANVPEGCEQAHVLELVADDLCRHAARPTLPLAVVARLRVMLKQTGDCPGSPARMP